MDQEEEYLDIRDKLRSLEKVKASDNFVHNLHSKIVGLESEKRQEHQARFEKGRGGFLKNLFGNMQYPWLIPAAGFTILIFFVFYMTYMNKSLTGSNQELSTNQKQETQNQNSSGITQDKPKENNPPQLSEGGTGLNKKDSTRQKDIAGDLSVKKERVIENYPSPTETMKDYKEKTEPEIYREEGKTSVERNTDESSDSKTEDKKLSAPEMKMKVKSDNDDRVDAAPSVSDGLRGILSTDTLKKSRLKEKIDSVSKLDLEKLRLEILK